MERLSNLALCRGLFGILAFVSCLHAQTLKQIATIDLSGPKGERFDYLTMDDEDHYLLSAHLGPGILYVIDVQTNKLMKAITGVPGITGLEYIPGLRKVYISDWGEEKIGIVDLRTMSVIKRLATAAKPNGITYAPPFHKLYVSDTLGKAVAIIDVDKDEIVKTLEFKSETGMPQYDSVARKVYVNLRNLNEVAEIDPATDTVLGIYPVDGCTFNSRNGAGLRAPSGISSVQRDQDPYGSCFGYPQRLPIFPSLPGRTW